MRRPSSRNPAVMRAFWSSGTPAQSRTRSGPWLAAKQPTSSAIAQPAHELVVLHADAEAIEAQQVRIGSFSKVAHVIVLERFLRRAVDAIARQYFISVRAVLGGDRGILQI